MVVPSRRRHRPGGRSFGDVLCGVEASRRAGWAKWYDAEDRLAEVQVLTDVLRDRIEVLVPVCVDLVDAVLHERNPEAFARAYRVQQLIDGFVAGARR